LGCYVGDGPGNDDSLLRITNEEIGMRWAEKVATWAFDHPQENGQESTKVKFIVFESMKESRVQLRATLLALFTQFGEAIRPGIVVVVSKYDTASEIREAKITETMEALGLSKLVRWQSFGLDPGGQQEQLAALIAKLDEATAVCTTDLQSFWQRQQDRQQALFNGQPTRSKQISVEEEYSEPYMETESWTEHEPYQSRETQKVSWQESRQVKEYEPKRFVKNITFLDNWKHRCEFTDKPQEAIRGISFIQRRFHFEEALYILQHRLDPQPPSKPGYQTINFDFMTNHSTSLDDIRFHYDQHPSEPVDFDFGQRWGNYLCVTREDDAPPITAVTFLADLGSKALPWTVVPDNLMKDWKPPFDGAPKPSGRYLGYKVATITHKAVQVPMDKDVSVDVTKYRLIPKSRQVQRHRPAKRTVIKTVDYKLAFEDFYHQAYDEVLREIRSGFAAGHM
jgi:hypothetical protein